MQEFSGTYQAGANSLPRNCLGVQELTSQPCASVFGIMHFVVMIRTNSVNGSPVETVRPLAKEEGGSNSADRLELATPIA